MKVTHTKDLLFQLLEGCHGLAKEDVKHSNFTTKGTECIIEMNGEFYRISVEHMQSHDA